MQIFDVIVIGAGQSGLATGYYLRRTGLTFIILDKEKEPGGAWQHYWSSLRLFSPAQWSSLPGTMMQGGTSYYPTRDETIAYLRQYELKYQLPIKRPVDVSTILKENNLFKLATSAGIYYARAIISATGSFYNPSVPVIPGMDLFNGLILHSSQYQSPDVFRNKRVAIVGEGNSGAQILAELSRVADTIWITSKEPQFHTDDVDGRYLFDVATKMYEAKKLGIEYKPLSLSNIVIVDAVKAARERGVFKNTWRPFQRFIQDGLVWADGHTEKADAVIFCTGFRPALQYLSSLDITNADGEIPTSETRAKSIEGLWLIGYGNWTGFASATLIGVGRTAKKTVEEVTAYINQQLL